MKQIDVRNLACPGPVIELRKLFESGEAQITMLVADDLARSNVTRFAESRGAKVSSQRDGDGFLITIHAGGSPTQAAPAVVDCELPTTIPTPASKAGPLVVQVGSSTMGHGDDELGTLLMRSFLKTQLQLAPRPDLLLFYNSGVRLCCDDSVLLDDLRALEQAGVEVIACGTCLNFFELADELRVGRVTDMLEIAGRLADAGSIIRP